MKYRNIFSLLFLTLTFFFTTGFITSNQLMHSSASSSSVPYNQRLLDNNYFTYFRKITDNVNTPIAFVNSNSSTGALKWKNMARHNYSKVQPWNADQTLIYIQNKTQNDPNTTVDELFLDGNGWGDTYKVTFSKKRPCRNESDPFGEQRWHPTNPDLRVYIGRNSPACSRSPDANGTLAIGTWNVRTGVETVLREFPKADYNYRKITFGLNEGNLSDNGELVAIVAAKPTLINGIEEDGETTVFVYDLKQDIKYDDISLSGVKLDWASISPSGTYIVVNGCFDSPTRCNDTGSYEVNEQTIYGANYDNKLGDRTQVLKNIKNLTLPPAKPIHQRVTQSWWEEHGRPSHYDLAIDNNNQEVAVGRSDWNSTEEGKVIKRNLTTGSITVLTDLARSGINKSFASHTSTRNIKRKGWAYVSYAHECGKVPLAWPLYCDEIVAVSLDGSGKVERWLKMQQTTSDYEAQPQAVPSPDGERVLWASRWTMSGSIGTYVAEH